METTEPTATHTFEGNTSALSTATGPQLRPMDRDQPRCWSMKLRALADLLDVGEPVCWATPYYDSKIEEWCVYVSRAAITAAEIAVRQRVPAGDED